MTLIKANCKFCKRPLSLHIADDYLKLQEKHNELLKKALCAPVNLIPMACCNSCSDYMEKRRSVFYAVKDYCMRLFSGEVKAKKDEDKAKAREILTKLVQRYMRVIADHRDLPMPQWDEVLVDDIMAKPGNFSSVLSRVHNVFSQGQLV